MIAPSDGCRDNCTPHNVILLTIDSLRSDCLGYAARKPQRQTPAPFLGGFMESAAVFSQCFSQGTTTAPSFASLLTSTYPLEYGGHWYLDSARATLAEVLQNSGYHTAAFLSNPYLSRIRNFHRGFDVFEENLTPWNWDWILRALPQRVSEQWVNKFFRLLRRQPYLPAGIMNRKALRWVRSARQPFFLWIHYMDVHGPYLLRRGFSYVDKFRAEKIWHKANRYPNQLSNKEKERLIQGYRSEIRYLDAEFARLVEEIKKLGLLTTTLVVILADHGEEFGEHGRFGHMNRPYEELIRVPLIFRFPDGAMNRSILGDPVRLMDVMPTILEYLSIEANPPLVQQIKGRSLLPLIKGQTLPPLDHIFVEKGDRGFQVDFSSVQAAVLADGWKFIADHEAGTRELYNLKADPRECHNLLADEPDTAQALEAVLIEHLTSLIQESSGDVAYTVDEADEVTERLRALGYMD